MQEGGIFVWPELDEQMISSGDVDGKLQVFNVVCLLFNRLPRLFRGGYIEAFGISDLARAADASS